MSVRARLATPAGRAAALAVIDLSSRSADELDAFIRICAGVRTEPGELRLARLAGVDRGLVIRWTPTFAQLTPHGGTAVVDELLNALAAGGAEVVAAFPPEEAYPEARSDVDARALAALARAASPLAVDLLLAQHGRWASGRRVAASPRTGRDDRLMRLIEPALVVVVGAPNVGKSTLLNTLAGRDLALVAGEAGTTRDHVGAWVNLGGLVVRWVDTPGIRTAAGPEADAIAIASRLAMDADLLVGVGDGASADPVMLLPRMPDLVVALRSDLGLPGWAHGLVVSARTGAGVADLVELVRERLVPRADLGSDEPWRFW